MEAELILTEPSLLISGENCWANKWNYYKLNAAATSVTGLSQGVYQFELKVTDNGASDLDTIQVTVNSVPVVNQLPTANAGIDQTILYRQTVFHSMEAGTDPDGTITAYVWRKLQGQQVELLQIQTLLQQP